MRSRELLAMIDAAATLSPTRANGQECARPALIFYVATTVPADVDAFRKAVRDLGYGEGRDISIVCGPGPPGKVQPEILPPLLRELVARTPDVILTPGGSLSSRR